LFRTPIFTCPPSKRNWTAVRLSTAFSRLMQVASPFRLCGRTYMTLPSHLPSLTSSHSCRLGRSGLVCSNPFLVVGSPPIRHILYVNAFASAEADPAATKNRWSDYPSYSRPHCVCMRCMRCMRRLRDTMELLPRCRVLWATVLRCTAARSPLPFWRSCRALRASSIRMYRHILIHAPTNPPTGALTLSAGNLE
jgi:hypothetical protein